MEDCYVALTKREIREMIADLTLPSAWPKTREIGLILADALKGRLTTEGTRRKIATVLGELPAKSKPVKQGAAFPLILGDYDR